MNSFTDRVSALGIPADSFVVIGSGLLDAYDLRTANDIDLAVDEATFERLKSDPNYQHDVRGDLEVLTSDGVEIWRGWTESMPYDKLVASAIEVDGIRYASPSTIIDFKRQRGSDKDLSDIELLERHMADEANSLSVPRHIGYIVDGNRRWAKQHGLPTYEGHLAGYNALKDVALETLRQGVEYMSAYVFSTENWKRSADEVQRLMALTLRILQADIPLFNEHNVRLRVLGSREGVSDKICREIDNAEAATAQNTGGVFAVCFNYGGQLEIVDAVKKLVQSGVDVASISTEAIENNLYAPEVPAIDVVVRTSGEQRLSNFMLWRSAYSEFIFLKKMWPDMTAADVSEVIKEYSRRQRRFGG
ncbi:di-trans,poly-cis-decaprenylcistransferase [Candidatus Saccharibacteria bacterium 32-49-12]|nr:MAG: di-trans,poly-cis-decaprenylcistransferase [Candidatus Saccharibacteria bacterium 32-49-12]